MVLTLLLLKINICFLSNAETSHSTHHHRASPTGEGSTPSRFAPSLIGFFGGVKNPHYFNNTTMFQLVSLLTLFITKTYIQKK